MVKYENPHIPDHMNRSQTNPLWDFTLLGLLVIGTIAALVFLAFVIGGFLGRLIPFSGEQWIVRQINPDWLERPTTGKAAELQELADRLTAHMNLPDGMEIVVHYVDDPTVNAFATVGGQVVMFRGLVSRVKSENELAMVMAHEIAHIKHRDVASSMGGAFLAAVVYSMLLGNDGINGNLLNSASGLLQLSFSRSAESAADAEGLLVERPRRGGEDRRARVRLLDQVLERDEVVPARGEGEAPVGQRGARQGRQRTEEGGGLRREREGGAGGR